MRRIVRSVLAGVALVGLVGLGQIGVAQSKSDQKSTDESAEASGESAGEVPSAKKIMEKIDDLYRSDTSKATMAMTVEKPRGTRKLKLESWSKGDEKALVVIREPAREAGTATLRTSEGLWNYAPRADRLIRIPSGLLSDSWMGSHFTNDDLMRETRYDDDYEGTVERAKYEGEEAYELTLTPKPDAPVVYSKLVFFVTRGDWVPLATEYYDKGEVVRTMRFSRVEKVDGKKVPMVMTLEPSDADDEMTRVEYEKLKFGVDIDDGLFSRRGLRRVAK